jgi:hypothetical protein
LSWVSTPLPPVKLLLTDKDVEMGGTDAINGVANQNPPTEQREVDYDVAEEDDRWMVN